jgi:putative membrane protein
VLLPALFWAPWTDGARFAAGVLALFLLPGLGAAILTTPIAEMLGGRFNVRRALLLSLTGLALQAPILVTGHLANVLFPSAAVDLGLVLLLAQGPTLWFRQLSLFGVSNPSRLRTLPVALIQPLLAWVGFSLVLPWSPSRFVAAFLFLLFGFLSAEMLIRAADRPIRREFQISGVALIRPILDHINSRDPAATAALEAFFARFAIAANLSATIVEFRCGGKPKLTLALPTVHPGPFASLGASDLPRKVAEHLGPGSGVVLVPHTPCNHELDVPSTPELARVLEAMVRLRDDLRVGPGSTRAGPLISPRPGSLARAQSLGGAILVLVSQAPGPTDDIAFAVGDTIRRRHTERNEGPIALVDAHNSYVEDRGDIAYGTPVAQQLLEDAEAAIAMARDAASDGPLEVGSATRTDYTVGDHGIGPAGIRVLAIRAAGRTTAYLLIDGNNLVLGGRATILEGLAGVVDDAEVMTTDNHIVHEVDGSTNPVGGRFPPARLARDCLALTRQAIADLEPAEVRSGTVGIPDVPVLGPAWTERLLTSLGDTVSVFGHQAAATMLLLLVSSLVVLVALR